MRTFSTLSQNKIYSELNYNMFKAFQYISDIKCSKIDIRLFVNSGCIDKTYSINIYLININNSIPYIFIVNRNVYVKIFFVYFATVFVSYFVIIPIKNLKVFIGIENSKWNSNCYEIFK